jgi:hypothetical protein
MLLILAGIGISAWQGTLSRDARAAHSIVLLAMLAAVAAAIVAGRRRQRQTTPEWLASSARTMGSWSRNSTAWQVSVAIWAFLILGIVAWDAVSFAEQAHSFPTLSRYIGDVTRYQAGRGAFFALWLAIGAYLAVGGRRRSDSPWP